MPGLIIIICDVRAKTLAVYSSIVDLRLRRRGNVEKVFTESDFFFVVAYMKMSFSPFISTICANIFYWIFFLSHSLARMRMWCGKSRDRCTMLAHHVVIYIGFGIECDAECRRCQV